MTPHWVPEPDPPDWWTLSLVWSVHTMGGVKTTAVRPEEWWPRRRLKELLESRPGPDEDEDEREEWIFRRSLFKSKIRELVISSWENIPFDSDWPRPDGLAGN